MITDIEEESKTKFSMGVEFTFLLKAQVKMTEVLLAFLDKKEYPISCGLTPRSVATS